MLSLLNLVISPSDSLNVLYRFLDIFIEKDMHIEPIKAVFLIKL